VATLAGTAEIARAGSLLTRGGEEPAIAWQTLPRRDDRGQVTGAMMVGTDHRTADEALRSSDARYRLLVDHAPVSFYVHDGTTIMFANRAFAKLLGYSAPLELVGQPLFVLLHPDDRGWIQGRIERLRAEAGDGFNAPVLGRLLGADGSVVHVEVVAAPTEFEGRPSILVVALDVTDRQRAEQALRRSEAQLSKAQRVAKLGSWESDLVDHRLQWSDELYRIFELDGERVPARRDTWLAVVHPEDRDAVIAAYEMSLKTRMPAAFTYRLRLPDGRIKHLHQHTETEYDGAGQPIRSLGTVQDVTEQENAAADRQLLETQLHHAQRMDALGTLAAGIAHDFNNILTAITANVSFALRKVGPSDAARESLDAISIAGARAAELVRQILTVGRRQPHQMRVVAIPAIICEALKLLRATIPTAVAIITDIAADTPCISADATQLHQVLMNLFTNSWQAMNGRAGTIHIRTSHVTLDADAARVDPELRPGRYALITVGDTGSGMDAPTLERIFDPFFTTKPVGEGSGLGLSVVHGIVKGHGGVVRATSSPGHGTTFQLYFPAVERSVEERPRSTTQPVARSEHQRRVLLVDDEAAIVRVFTRELTELGFQVSGFTRPREALEVIRSSDVPFDVVVTDQRMPELSGFDLAREIRQIGRDVPILLMSGHLSDELLGEGTALGISRFVGKPCSIDEIAALLEELVATRTAHR
jgi:PAS domain S-box-containing protein